MVEELQERIWSGEMRALEYERKDSAPFPDCIEEFLGAVFQQDVFGSLVAVNNSFLKVRSLREGRQPYMEIDDCLEARHLKSRILKACIGKGNLSILFACTGYSLVSSLIDKYFDQLDEVVLDGDVKRSPLMGETENFSLAAKRLSGYPTVFTFSHDAIYLYELR